MHEFTLEEKNRIAKLQCKAEDLFFMHRKVCEQIEIILNGKNPEEEESVCDVIYQPSDGICVVYSAENFTSDSGIENNIPLLRYLNGDRV